jgi:hypothetical protein
MDVMTAQPAEQRKTTMTTFTIDSDNNITAHATPEEAAAATTTPFDSFSTEQELAELAGQWPAERLVAILNSLPGETPVKKVKDPKTAASRIWARIQGLGDVAKPEAPAKPKAGKKAKSGAQAAKGAPAKGKATKKATPAKTAPKAKKSPAKTREAGAPREGSKMAQVIALMQRKGGVSISEVMEKMGWQKHTVRGFVAGALKKAGYTVESFKPEGGERSYRIKK